MDEHSTGPFRNAGDSQERRTGPVRRQHGHGGARQASAAAGTAREAPVSQSLASFCSRSTSFALSGGATRSSATYSASVSSSSPMSSSSSPSAEVTGPAQAWASLLERKTQEFHDAEKSTPVERREARKGPQERRSELQHTKKRSNADREKEMELMQESSSQADASVSDSIKPQKQKRTPVKRIRKHRKATHTIRKEEIERLLVEVAELREKMASLKKRVLPPSVEENEEESEEVQMGKSLREGVRYHQNKFAGLLAVMTEYTLCNVRAGSPIQESIYLEKDQQSRRETLCALKPRKMEKARYFMKNRRPELDPCTNMAEERRYEMENGDFCSSRFRVVRFEGAHSVRQVFDLLVYYFCNIEISISEKLGHITIREDDDNPDKGITQNRLVSTTNKGVKVESNTVNFSEFTPDASDAAGGCGLIVGDFVDDDKRHPYRPEERVRRDVNAVMELRAFPRERVRPRVEGDAGQEKVVVLTKWVHTRMHHPRFPVRSDGWYELRDNMDLWGHAMHHTMMENLHTIA